MNIAKITNFPKFVKNFITSITFIEVMVVIGIICFLTALMIPCFVQASRAKELPIGSSATIKGLDLKCTINKFYNNDVEVLVINKNGEVEKLTLNRNLITNVKR